MAKVAPTTSLPPAIDLPDHPEDSGVVNKLDLNYIPFEDPPKPRQVDKRIFIPLYLITACVMLFSHFLPTALVVLLVLAWAIVFIGTPLYYLYHYDPLGVGDPCECCKDATLNTTTSSLEKPPPVRTASV